MYRRGKIIAVGQVWECALREYWNDASLSVNKIAERLGVDPRTVKRHTQRLKLSMVRMNKKKALAMPPQRISGAEHDAEVGQSHLDLMRTEWQKACETHGHRGRKFVRLQIPQVYTWLYRHDRDWLEQHLPPRKRPEPAQRVDWTVRDTRISQLIPEAAQRLRTQSGRPRRISIAAIGRAIGYTAMMQQHLDLLPSTAATLAEVEESRIAFAIRRIQWASTHFYNQGRVPKRWELVRLSGVGLLLSNVVVKDALDAALGKLQQLLMLR